MATDPLDFDDDEFPDDLEGEDIDDDVPLGTPGRTLPEDLMRLTTKIRVPVLLRTKDPSVPYYRFDRFDVYAYKFGGMGMVLEAYDTELDRRVAIKLWLNRGSTASTMLMVEARALAKLSHPNVVTIYETGTWNERVYFVMEWVDGWDGRTWMKAGQHTWQEIRSVFVQAAKGLAAAHDVGIQHRDFKPANILIGSDGRVRVSDFGVADVSRGEESKDAFGPMAGTLDYMAPERLLGHRGGPKSDQFSLCVSMWEAMFGYRPFDGDTREELLDAIVNVRVNGSLDEPGLPRWMIEAVAVGLMPNPQDRYSSMQELIVSMVLEDNLGDDDGEPDGGAESGGGAEPDGGGEVGSGSGGDDEPPVLHQPSQAVLHEPEPLGIDVSRLPAPAAALSQVGDEPHGGEIGDAGPGEPQDGDEDDGEVVGARGWASSPTRIGYGSPTPPQATRWIAAAFGGGLTLGLVGVLAFMAGSWWSTQVLERAPRESTELREAVAVDDTPITPEQVIEHIEAGTYDETVEADWTAEEQRRAALDVPTYHDNLRISEAFLQQYALLKERDQEAARSAVSHADSWCRAARTNLNRYDQSDLADVVADLDELVYEVDAALAELDELNDD